MQTQGALLSQRKKTKELKDWDEDGFASKSLRWNQLAQTKKNNNYCNLEPKWCRNKLWIIQLTRHTMAQSC